MMATADETAAPLASALVRAGWPGRGGRTALSNGPAPGSLISLLDRPRDPRWWPPRRAARRRGAAGGEGLPHRIPEPRAATQGLSRGTSAGPARTRIRRRSKPRDSSIPRTRGRTLRPGLAGHPDVEQCHVHPARGRPCPRQAGSRPPAMGRTLTPGSPRRKPHAASRAIRVLRCTPSPRAARLWFQSSRSSARST
jgi:hypothetical protein